MPEPMRQAAPSGEYLLRKSMCGMRARLKTSSWQCAASPTQSYLRSRIVRMQVAASLLSDVRCPGLARGGERQLRCQQLDRMAGRRGSIRARRAKEDLSFAGRGRAVEARWSADPHIADTHGGTGCRAGCLFDGADPTCAQRRRPAPCAAHRRVSRWTRRMR